MKRLVVLGSTGSIGKQTLDVVTQHPRKFEIVALACNNNIELLNEQIQRFNPKMIGVINPKGKDNVKVPKHAKLFLGEKAIIEMVEEAACDVVVVAIAGAAGLKPTIAAIKSGKSVALATKEVMVLAGNLVKRMIKTKNEELKKAGKPLIDLYPIDSEHSAIWQSLRSGTHDEIEKIILTCSGGPFRGKTKADLETVTVENALNHPNWKMGKRITIDSSTLMNKGLEVIEAQLLFDVDPDMVEVVIHPQSILHSAIQFQDGSIIGQMGLPDMRLPIQYALTYPERPRNTYPRMSFADIGSLTFTKPDIETFPCLSFAYKAIKTGGTMPTILNAADEIAVDLFLQKKINFLDIPTVIHNAMDAHSVIQEPSIEDILEADLWARQYTASIHTV